MPGPHRKEESEKDKTVNAEQSSWTGMGQRLSAEERAKREWLAADMVRFCGDLHSLGFYRKVARRVPEQRIFEVLSEVRTAVREGRVKKSPGALFVSIIQEGSERIGGLS